MRVNKAKKRRRKVASAIGMFVNARGLQHERAKVHYGSLLEPLSTLG